MFKGMAFAQGSRCSSSSMLVKASSGADAAHVQGHGLRTGQQQQQHHHQSIMTASSGADAAAAKGYGVRIGQQVWCSSRVQQQQHDMQAPAQLRGNGMSEGTAAAAAAATVAAGPSSSVHRAPAGVRSQACLLCTHAAASYSASVTSIA
jgi:hypothetical protein